MIDDLKNKQLWYSDDIQSALDYVRQNNDVENKLIKNLIAHVNNYDVDNILYCLKDGVAESFERFDSDICEQFIYYFKESVWGKTH